MPSPIASPKKSAWFDGSTAPYYVGVYRRQLWTGTNTDNPIRVYVFTYWNGREWGEDGSTPEQAFERRGNPSKTQSARWQGLAQNPLTNVPEGVRLLQLARTIEPVPAWATHIAVRFQGTKVEPAAWNAEHRCYFDEGPGQYKKGDWASCFKAVYWTFFALDLVRGPAHR